MSLMRMAGLIALSVAATTFQASARPAPAAKPDAPARQDTPARSTPPRQKIAQQDQKPELVLVIAPLTSAWSDSARHLTLDGSGPGAGAEQILLSVPVENDWRTAANPALESTVSHRSIQATRAWLIARYPHAPPA